MPLICNYSMRDFVILAAKTLYLCISRVTELPSASLIHVDCLCSVHPPTKRTQVPFHSRYLVK